MASLGEGTHGVGDQSDSFENMTTFPQDSSTIPIIAHDLGKNYPQLCLGPSSPFHEALHCALIYRLAWS